MTTPLHQIINLHQVLAWIKYRTARAVDLSRSEQAHAALLLDYVDPPEIPFTALVHEPHIYECLRSGQLQAYFDSSGVETAIDPFAWREHITLSRHEPYKQILFHAADVFKIWPEAKKRSRSPYQKAEARELYGQILKEMPELTGQRAAARELSKRYQHQISRKHFPPEDTCVGWIREWIGV